MGMVILKVIIISCLVGDIMCDERPIVESPAGKFRGRVIKSRNRRDIYAFEGIPYAKPPVGEFRFKYPKQLPQLEGIYDATNDSKICFQPKMGKSLVNYKNHDTYTGSEDCLYLNIYVPKVDNNSFLLPILFWIHGGGFITGSGSTESNNPSFLLDKDMILVTINYRLGIFGFFSTGDEDVEDNFGIADQIAALRWVQKNIPSFKGDPKTVTIGGSSAGAISATFLKNLWIQGLYKRVIAMSGSVASINSFQTIQDAKIQSTKMAEILQCSSKPKKLLECLQNKTTIDIVAASMSLQPKEILECCMHYQPVSSKPSFTKERFDNNSAKIPILTGVTSREAIMFYVGLMSKYKKGGLEALRKDLPKLIPIWTFTVGTSNTKFKNTLNKELEQFYFKEGTENATAEQIIDLVSDLLGGWGVNYIAKYGKATTYLYMFSYKGSNEIPKQDLPTGVEDGVGHGEELQYLFGSTKQTSTWSKQDIKMSEQMVNMWYKFVKFGNPIPDGSWLESEEGTNYLDITNKGLIMKTNMFQQRMQFYDRLIDKLEELDN